MTLRLKLLHLFGRAVMLRTARNASPLEMREAFRKLTTTWLLPPPLTLALPRTIASREALVITNRPGSHPPPPNRALLWFHGGAFVAGSPQTHLGMIARLARDARIEAIAPHYRRAPEDPFPAAVDDARAAFDALVARGLSPANIVIGGDSAGGNLVLGLLAGLLADGIRPAGLVAMSPATDLTFSSPSLVENARRDSMLPAERQGDINLYYLAGADPADPRASPLFADFPDPPPVFLQYSASEILRDDSRRMAERLRSFGGEVTCDEWPDTPHVFTLFGGWVPEAREGIARAARFIDGLWAGSA